MKHYSTKSAVRKRRALVVPWTKRDCDRNMPDRLESALRRTGDNAADLVRTVFRDYIADIEQHGA